MTKRVVIYSRVSSKGTRQSTERQVFDLESLAASRGYVVVNVFEEQASGRKMNREREVLRRCVDYCVNPVNNVEMLFVTEISRLGRTTLEVLKSLDELHAHGINVYIQNINIETLLPDGRVNPVASIITTILAELANIEWQGIVDRLQSGRRLYIENGGKTGRPIGSVKTKEQKKEQYKEVISLLKRGYSIRNVAKLSGKSVSTVQRIKIDFEIE